LDTRPLKGGLLFTFLSAKGGTGTSSLCANLAMNLAANQPDSRVIVVDMVLPIGSIAHIVGYEGAQNLIEVAALPEERISPDYFRENLAELDVWGFHLLAGSPDPERSRQLSVDRVPPIIGALRGVYDYVLLDIGRALSRITMPLIEESDLIVLIVSTDTSTVALTRTLVYYLKDKGIDPRRIYGILNRAVGLEGMTKVEAEKVIGISIKTAMPHLSGQVALANNLHQPLSAKYPRDTIAIILKETAQEMASLGRRLRDR
jgi:pilus assembly protein CpaE